MAVKNRPCCICGKAPPSAAHHIETGMGRKKKHMKTIPLCDFHHQGQMGIHTLGKKAWQKKFGTERELWEAL